MKRSTLLTLAAAALVALPLRPAAAKELAGVNMPDTVSIGGKTLKLNGLGLRKKAIFKVYVGASTSRRPRRTPPRSSRRTRRRPSG